MARLLSPDELLRSAIYPACALLGPAFATPAAHRELVAIAIQESDLRTRWQIVDASRPGKKGPARSFWQGEKTGGMVAGVLSHASSKFWMHRLCAARNVGTTAAQVFAAIEVDDVLAAGAARLLLFTDPRKLPTDEAGAWSYYKRNWNPGKPHPERWPAAWAEATKAVPL